MKKANVIFNFFQLRLEGYKSMNCNFISLKHSLSKTYGFLHLSRSIIKQYGFSSWLLYLKHSIIEKEEKEDQNHPFGTSNTKCTYSKVKKFFWSIKRITCIYIYSQMRLKYCKNYSKIWSLKLIVNLTKCTFNRGSMKFPVFF